MDELGESAEARRGTPPTVAQIVGFVSPASLRVPILKHTG
jgi:hypothetical protein